MSSVIENERQTVVKSNNDHLVYKTNDLVSEETVTHSTVLENQSGPSYPHAEDYSLKTMIRTDCNNEFGYKDIETEHPITNSENRDDVQLRLEVEAQIQPPSRSVEHCVSHDQELDPGNPPILHTYHELESTQGDPTIANGHHYPIESNDSSVSHRDLMTYSEPNNHNITHNQPLTDPPVAHNNENYMVELQTVSTSHVQGAQHENGLLPTEEIDVFLDSLDSRNKIHSSSFNNYDVTHGKSN